MKYDSVHGKSEHVYTNEKEYLTINGNKVHCFSQRDPKLIEWSKFGVDYVIEATGMLTSTKIASKHLVLNPNIRVIITAPSNDAPMFVMGVNNMDYAKEQIFSNASCTTNCLAPLAKILHQNEDDKNKGEKLQHIIDSSQHLLNLLNEIMDYTKVESGAYSKMVFL